MSLFAKRLKRDREALGFSLQEVVDRLNADAARPGGRTVTISWLSHVENNRTKKLSRDVLRWLARALEQKEELYIDYNFEQQPDELTLPAFINHELGRSPNDSTLFAEVPSHGLQSDRSPEILATFYEFMAYSGGRLIFFNKADDLLLLTCLVGLRAAYEDNEDLEIHRTAQHILQPVHAGVAFPVNLPPITPRVLRWIENRLSVFTPAQDVVEEILGLNPVSFFLLLPPMNRLSREAMRGYYSIDDQNFGRLSPADTELLHDRFLRFQRGNMFEQKDYAGGGPEQILEEGRKFGIRFAEQQ